MLPIALSLAVAQGGNLTTTAERTAFRETGRYAEAVELCRRLDARSKQAKMITFGTSPEGRPMVALVISEEGRFNAPALRGSRKPLIFVNNGIHSGEIEGKDASLMLAREMLLGRERALLKGVNAVIVPVYSVDAHERFGPYNRINQNGPREMGWRSQSNNLNLNRDFTKADAPETRALLGLLHTYRPDFFFDNHTTDGGDWQYTLGLGVPSGPTMSGPMAQWQRSMYAAVREACEKDGFLTAPYFGMADRADPTKGITVEDFSPRYSTGYLTAMNRPNMLVETHVLKPYRDRVLATYSVVKRTIEYCALSSEFLRATRSAFAAGAPGEGTPVVLATQLAKSTRPFTFKGWEYAPYRGEAGGGTIPAWKHVPLDFASTIRDTFEPTVSVAAPGAYLIPAQWTEAIERLKLHNIEFRRLRHAVEGEFESYAFSEVGFPAVPFEGRFRPRYKVTRIVERRRFPAGSAVVSTRQSGLKLATHLLEPEAPDSLMAWGFFNAVFERKEYFETYAMEPVAKEMLAKDPGLRKEFEERLKDEAFARDPAARLRWLYDRSLYADVRLDKYPVARLTSRQLEDLP